MEDIKSVSDLKKKTNEIFKQMHRTGRPIIVTVNGKPDAVLLDVEIFERKPCFVGDSGESKRRKTCSCFPFCFLDIFSNFCYAYGTNRIQ